MGKDFSAELAARRFGLLARDGHSGQASSAMLLGQIGNVAAARIAGPGAMTTAEVEAHCIEKGRQTRARRDEMKTRLADGMAQAMPVPKLTVPSVGELLASELDLRLARAHETDAPLLERLALFWTNHFTVSAERGSVGNYAGAFEREAVRPNMQGRFADLLVAAATHPAMQLYLDNTSSYGPTSSLGLRKKRGINENLAREILELHTLGADGGYSQGDVEEFAKALTGWTATLRPDVAVPEGAWPTFDEQAHEPGPKRVLGRTYREDGPAQAVAILRDLAAHPATARHVARRLSLHFFGETCPAAVTAALERAFQQGDLAASYRALVTNEAGAALPARRMRPPLEHLLVIGRLLGWRPEPIKGIVALRALGQPYFRAPSPAGWPEKDDDDWASAVQVKRRLDVVYGIAAGFENRIDPRALAEQALGPWLSPTLARAIERAPSAREGLTLLLMSPEVVRR